MERRNVINNLFGVILCLVLTVGSFPIYAFAQEIPDDSLDAKQSQEEQNTQPTTEKNEVRGAVVDNDCVTFSSATRLQLATYNQQKTWDGTMEYSTDKINWTVWDVRYINSAEGVDGNHYIYVRGDNNTVVSGGTTWALMKPDLDATIGVSGNIETLRGATGNKSSDIQMAANCYGGMFRDDEWLSSAPKLTATSLSKNCYNQMFQDCISLKQAPELSADTLAEGCYQYMFRGCNGLTTAPELPATELAEYCYANMFDSCTYLKNAPTVLPAKNLVDNCYREMFYECISLETVPKLPAKNLAESCYEGMFANCTVLKQAPKLPATVLAKYCYFGMFTRCWELQSTPKLPAKELVDGCYSEMFLDCRSLSAPADISGVTKLAKSCCYRMYEGCNNIAVYTEAKKGITKKWKATSAAKDAEDWNNDMFTLTYGDFTGAPVRGTTYYIADRAPKVHTAVPADVDGGYVRINQKYFATGKTVEAEAVPDKGYVTVSFAARDEHGREIPIVNNQFIMPDSDVTLVATFKLDISKCNVSGINESYTYTGKAIEPAITVTIGDTTLAQDKDYTVSYANNIDTGTANVIITGIGDYAGTVNKTFTIVKAKSESNIATGDSNNIGLFGIMGILALCGVGFVYKRRED